jgi:hypothetical protein
MTLATTPCADWTSLPPDTIVAIATILAKEPRDLVSMMCVCKRFRTHARAIRSSVRLRPAGLGRLADSVVGAEQALPLLNKACWDLSNVTTVVPWTSMLGKQDSTPGFQNVEEDSIMNALRAIGRRFTLDLCVSRMDVLYLVLRALQRLQRDARAGVLLGLSRPRVVIRISLERAPYASYIAGTYDAYILKMLADVCASSMSCDIVVTPCRMWVGSCSLGCMRLLSDPDFMHQWQQLRSLHVDITTNRDVTVLDLTHVAPHTSVRLVLRATKASHLIHVHGASRVCDVVVHKGTLAGSCASWFTLDLLSKELDLRNLTFHSAADLEHLLAMLDRCQRHEPLAARRLCSQLTIRLAVTECGAENLHLLHALLACAHVAVTVTLQARSPHVFLTACLICEFVAARSLRLSTRVVVADDAVGALLDGREEAALRALRLLGPRVMVERLISAWNDHTFFWMLLRDA